MTGQPRGAGFSTLALHAGGLSGPPDALIETDRSALGQVSSDGGGQNNPTRAVLEERIATLEGGSAALALGSDSAAHLIALHALLRPGDTFIASRRLELRFGHTFAHAFKTFGWQVAWVDPDAPDQFIEALNDRTRAILIESIAETGTVTDIEAVAGLAQRARVPLLVDNTLATPYLVRPVELGADIVVHSSTRLLAGHASAVGGLIVDGGSFEWTGDDRFPSLSQPRPGRGEASLADTYGNYAFAVACRELGLGDPLPSSDATRILDGLETMALRVQRQSDSALAVAQHLSRHQAVGWVRYAGLDNDAAQQIARRVSPRGAGLAFAFALTGGRRAGADLLRRLALFRPLDQVGDTRSRICHPASATSPGDSDPDLVWVSIGLEDSADLIADLDQALAA